MIRVGIVGVTGYGGRELLRLLLNHGQTKISALVSESSPGVPLSEILPAYRGLVDQQLEAFDAKVLAENCDVVFIGVPGGKSMPYVAGLRQSGVRVLDIGPDFRIKDPSVWQEYYKIGHSAQELLPEAVYGLPALNREALRQAQLVAVPGCYPMTAVLPLRPLLDYIPGGTVVIVDAISGISGAGKSLNEAFHFPEMNENLKAYKLAVHQHTPEIEQALDNRVLVQFTPHVAPITRGILSTITVRMPEPFDVAQAYAVYDEEPFVRVLGEGNLPEVKYVRGTNFCDIGWVRDQRTKNLLIVSAIDNIFGGTAGAAVQCMNLMFGVEETAGLRHAGLTP